MILMCTLLLKIMSPVPSASLITMSGSSTIRALVSRAKKTPAAVEMINRINDLPKESTIKSSPGECKLRVKVRGLYSTKLTP